MTRRRSLIATIAVLAVALAFVVVQIVRGQGAGGTDEQRAAAAESASPSPDSSATGATDGADGVGWWPLHGSGTAKAGEHDAVVSGGARWTDGPRGGALWLDGTDGYAATGTRLDTVGGDYSVAARVRLLPEDMKGIHTAVSQDGDRSSTFYLQYSAPDGNFAFSVPGARAVAGKDAGAAEPKAGQWYQLTGTYDHEHHRLRIYVNGRLAGSRHASSTVKPTGGVVIGRAKFRGRATDFWRGGIADVHVYDRELTPREVRALSSRQPD